MNKENVWTIALISEPNGCEDIIQMSRFMAYEITKRRNKNFSFIFKRSSTNGFSSNGFQK